jgi:hypothetical protein
VATTTLTSRVGVWVSERVPVYWLSLAAVGTAFHLVVNFECPFRAATGWDCPVCGGTRAIGNLVHLDLLAAVRDNLLVVVLSVVLVVRLLPGVRVGRTGDVLAARMASIPPPVWVGLLVAWTIFRNLPGLIWLSPDR